MSPGNRYARFRLDAMAEKFRDEGRVIFCFRRHIYRYPGCGNGVRAVGRGRRLRQLSADTGRSKMGVIKKSAHYSTKTGPDYPAICEYVSIDDWNSDPSPATTFAHLDANCGAIALISSRRLVIYPAVDPLGFNITPD
jgi:F0F1-type ATP synthase beta subunit